MPGSSLGGEEGNVHSPDLHFLIYWKQEVGGVCSPGTQGAS